MAGIKCEIIAGVNNVAFSRKHAPTIECMSERPVCGTYSYFDSILLTNIRLWKKSCILFEMCIRTSPHSFTELHLIMSA